MNRTSVLLVTLAVGAGAAGCGGGGGGGGSGVSGITSITPIGSASYIPTQVTRDRQGYAFRLAYQPNAAAGGAITAAAVSPVNTDIFVGISPLGRVDMVNAVGGQTEVAFVFDVTNFASVNSELYAATGNPIASRAGQVYQRPMGGGSWLLSLDGSQKEAVTVALGNTLYAFQGENDGPDGTVSVMSSTTNTWRNVAALASFVPTCAVELNGELWIGGHKNDSRGHGPLLFRGAGARFSGTAIPVPSGPGQAVSVSAIGVANGALFVAVETRDANSGQTLGGSLFALDSKGLVAINNMQGDAPISLVAVDGTIYSGTRKGKLLWLDEMGKFNEEKGLPSNLGVTALVNNGGRLFVGVKSLTGAQLLRRDPQSGILPPPPPPAGLAFTSITPSNGPMAGGTPVVIRGNNFADVNQVTIGGVPITALQKISDVEIRGTTAAGTSGPQALRIVSSTKGTLNVPAAFTYGAAQLTYTANIAALLNKVGPSGRRCLECHVAGGAAGFAPLTNYTEVRAKVTPGNVASSLLSNKIAPGGTMNQHIAAADITTINTWITQGANQ